MFSFLLLIIPGIFMLNMLYYLFIANLLEKQAVQDMRQLTSSLSNQLDGLVRNIDRVAINVAFSQELSHILENNETVIDPTHKYNNSLKIKSILQQINEFSFVARNIYIYTKSGNIFDYGVNPINNESVAEKWDLMPWIEETYQIDSGFLLVPPHPNHWSDNAVPAVFSITRQLRYISRVYAVVEVQQDFNKIEKIIEKNGSFFQGQVLLLDQDQHQIYPNPSQRAFDYNWQSLLSHLDDPDNKTLILDSGEMVYLKQSDYTDWTTVMLIPKEALFAKLLSSGTQ